MGERAERRGRPIHCEHPLHIAEVKAHETNKDASRFFHIASGSLAELLSQLKAAHKIDYVEAFTANHPNKRHGFPAMVFEITEGLEMHGPRVYWIHAEMK